VVSEWSVSGQWVVSEWSASGQRVVSEWSVWSVGAGTLLPPRHQHYHHHERGAFVTHVQPLSSSSSSTEHTLETCAPHRMRVFSRSTNNTVSVQVLLLGDRL